VSDISIGTVRSEVRIGLDKLDQDVAEAKSALASLAASLNSAVETFSAKMTADATLAAAAQERSAAASVERIAQQQRAAGERQLRQQKADLEKAEQQAKQSQERALAAARQIGGQLQMIGGAALLALGAASKVGMDFETTLVHVANNTTMTTADIEKMSAAVKDLGRSSGADLTQLAEGFMHASNFGFTAAESTVILTEAMKSAVSTGGDVGKTTEILANVMHEFSIPVGEAGRAMNVLHLAAAQGNATLEQFVEAGGPAFAMAANLGVGMTETAAAMSALTKHGFTAAEAATQVRNILSHIAEPAGKTKDILEQLSKTTGVNLVRDFSLAGLQGKGMAGILDDIKMAAERAHVSTSDLMMKLVPAMRGGIGAMALAGTAAKDFKQELVSLADAMAGKVDPTMTAYTRQQATLAAQTNKAKNELTLMSSDIEKALMPALRGLIGVISGAAKWFQDLSPDVKSAAVQLSALGGVAALVGGTALKMGAQFMALRTGLIAAGLEFGTFAAFAEVLVPAALAVGGVAAAAWALDAAIKAVAGDTGKTTAEIRKQAEADAKSAIAARDHGTEINRLVQRYEELKQIVHPTAANLEEMRQILDKISTVSPSLVTGYNKQGDALGLVAGAARRATDDLAALEKQARITSAAVIAVQGQELAQKRSDLDDQRRHQQDLIKRKVGERIVNIETLPDEYGRTFNSSSHAEQFPVAANSGAMSVSAQKLRDYKNQIAEIDKQTKGLDAQMRNVFKNGVGTPDAPPPKTDPNKNTSVNGGGGSSKAAKAAKRDAEELQQALGQVQDKLYAIGHSDFQVQMRDAWKEMGDSIKAGVPALQAHLLYNQEIAKLTREHAAEVAKEQGGTMAGAVSDMKSQAEMTLKNNAVPTDVLDAITNSVQRKLDLERMTEQSLQNQDQLEKKLLADIDAGIQAETDSYSREMQMQQDLTDGYKFYADQVKASDEEMKHRAENYAEYRAQEGGADLEAWRDLLQKKLMAAELWSDDYAQILRRLNEVKGRIEEENGPVAKKILKQMAANVESILGGAFERVFMGDTKNLLQDLLKSFEQMLAQMAAKALASGIMAMLLPGGGGFIAGLLGSLGGGGFDNGNNDRQARHWGYDFAGMFTQGMNDHSNSRMAAVAVGGSGGSSNNVTINMHGPVVRHEADIRDLSRQVAREVQNTLRARPGSGR
jgi:TP901 family phage tail tape measure protein